MKKILFILAFIPMLVHGQIIRPTPNITDPNPGPTINVVGSFVAFANTAGTPSTAQWVTYSSSFLTANMLITAGAGMEVSADSATWVAGTTGYTVTVPPAGPTGTTYLRVAAATGASSFSGSLHFASTGAAPVDVGYTATVSSGGTAHYRTITIDHTKIPNTDQTNFPVTLFGTLTYMKSTGNGGAVVNANAYDVVLTSDAAGLNVLPYERVVHNLSTGFIEYCFKVNLSHTTDLVVYLQYGNASITTDQSNRTGTWNSNFAAVYHVKDGSTLSAVDATSNAVNGSITGATATTGQVDGAAALSGSGQYINLGNHLGITGDFTIEAWVNPSSFTDYNAILTKTNGNQPKPYALYIEPTDGKCILFTGNGVGNTSIVATTGVTLNTWNYVAAQFNSSATIISHYLNGNINGSSFASGYPGAATGTENAYIGARSDLVFPFAGGLDEIRVSSFLLSADWLKTTYNNLNSPSTFYTIGAQQ